MRTVEIESDEKRRSSLMVSDSADVRSPKKPVVHFKSQLQFRNTGIDSHILCFACRYLTEGIVEEQIYKNATFVLRHLHRKVTDKNKELEIAFAQRNPAVVSELIEAEGEAKDRMKRQLQSEFQTCRQHGVQSWKLMRSQMETEVIGILQKINTALEQDLTHLTVCSFIFGCCAWHVVVENGRLCPAGHGTLSADQEGASNESGETQKRTSSKLSQRHDPSQTWVCCRTSMLYRSASVGFRQKTHD